MDRKLLDILCCPVTGVPLEPLRKDQLAALNELIAAGEVRDYGDNVVTDLLQEALITENGERIYRIDDGIPIMLEEKAIPGQLLRKG
ncbi:MAG: Trm112 family protein [Xanthomonadaceae bacterium]|nr:Trm112 family protein [Xanthomonadaceae bacterium]